MNAIEEMYLFEPDPPSVSHSPTSRAAAEQIKPHTNSQHESILKALRRVGPMTDEEIQQATGLNPSSERPRRVELLRLGRISPMGKGMTQSGRKAQRWGLSR